MIWLFTFTMLFSPVQTDTQSVSEQQIDIYFNNIEEGTAVSESVWALLAIVRGDSTRAPAIVDSGRKLHQEWVEHLVAAPDNQTAIHNIAKELNDEYLHLFLQLLRLEDDERARFFEDFYAQVETDRFIELNRRLAYSEEVAADLIIKDNWDFSYFLISEYKLNINFDSDAIQFYSGLSDHLLENQDNIHFSNKFQQDLYHFALLSTLHSSRQYSKIAELYEKFLELTYIPETNFKRDFYWRFYFAVYQDGQIDRSLNIQREYAIPLSKRLGLQSSLNTIMADHGASLYLLGKYQEAKQVLQTALADSANLNSSTRTRLLNNLGLVHYKLGETNRYIATQFRSLEFASEQDNFSHQLNIYRNLHIYYRNTRNWDLALDYISAARKLAETEGNNSELASIIISQAVYFHSFLDDLDQAKIYLDEAEQLLTDETDHELTVRILYERAEIYKKSGRLEESLEIFRDVANIGRENNNNSMYLEALVDQAEVELDLQNPQAAREIIREFNIHDITVVDFHVLVKARDLEARLAILDERYNEAEQILNHLSVQVLEWARNTTDPEGGYWHIEPAYLEMFQTYADLLIRLERYNDVTLLLDQFKTINDASLYNNPLIKADLLNEEELMEDRRLTQDIDRLRKRRVVSRDEDVDLELQNEISALTARKNQISQKNNFAREENRGFKPWVIQSRLNSTQAILHLTHILDRFYLVRIFRDQIDVEVIPAGTSGEELFEQAIQGLTSGDTDLNSLHEIYQLLNLDKLPSSIGSLIVIPDSYLYQLPLDVLPVLQPSGSSSYGAAHYLIEEMEISYLNNLKEFLVSSPKPFYELDFTGFGISQFQNPGAERQLVSLPKAPFEVKNIVHRLNRFNSTRAYTESDATPASFRQSAPQSQILHMATHSTISENDPLFSRLYLYPDSADTETAGEISGQIFAYQLFDMELQNDLIMLNSCESGSGRYYQGSGIMGISRALRYAGARSLILNSWSVNDQFASDFSLEFYKHINQGKSKSYALQAAKLYFLKNKNANPHYWGPYMLNGERDAMINRPETYPLYTFLLAFLLIGIWYTHRKQNGEQRVGLPG